MEGGSDPMVQSGGEKECVQELSDCSTSLQASLSWSFEPSKTQAGEVKKSQQHTEIKEKTMKLSNLTSVTQFGGTAEDLNFGCLGPNGIFYGSLY